MVILANKKGNEVRQQCFKKIDIELSGNSDFEMIINAWEWDEAFEYGARIFVPDTEFGGIISGMETNTADNVIKVSGSTWRGILKNKIIIPPNGEAYKIVTGDLNKILKLLIEDAGLSGIFSVQEVPSLEITYQFERYVTLYDGIIKMLAAVGYRLDVVYVQGTRGASGYVELSSKPIVDYSKTVEFSQDSQLDFTYKEKHTRINHLIALGQGELTNRLVAELFIQADGSVGPIPYYKGIEDATAVYDDTTISTEEELVKKGTEKLIELYGTPLMSITIETIPKQVQIGDIVGGRDYITGLHMAETVTNKIYKEENNQVLIEYEIGQK